MRSDGERAGDRAPPRGQIDRAAHLERELGELQRFARDDRRQEILTVDGRYRRRQIVRQQHFTGSPIERAETLAGEQAGAADLHDQPITHKPARSFALVGEVAVGDLDAA